MGRNSNLRMGTTSSHKKRQIHGKKSDVIDKNKPWMSPGKTIEFPIRERPQKWRRIKLIGVGWNIDKDMKKPAAYFPRNTAENLQPIEKEKNSAYEDKNKEAVADAIKSLGNLEKHSIVRRRLSRIGPRDERRNLAREKKLDNKPDKKRSESEKIRKDTPESRSPRRNTQTFARCSFRHCPSPKSVGKNIHRKLGLLGKLQPPIDKQGSPYKENPKLDSS